MTGGRSLVVLALALVGFSPRLSAQTTTLYSANFDSGTAEGWAFSSNSGVGYQLIQLSGNDWLLGPTPTLSGNLYSAPIDLTGYTSGNKLVLSFDLKNYNNTHQTLLVGIGDAPAPAAWLISSTANNWGPLHADLSASGVKQHFAFDITSYVTSFLATGGSVTGFRLAVMNYSYFEWLYIDNIALTATPATVAGAPTGVSASGGDTQAVVSFTAPASDGNSAITSYTVTSSPGGVTASGTASPLTVTGLVNGTSYTFTVTATNGLGTSSASSASAAVKPGVPQISNGGFETGTTGTLGVTPGSAVDAWVYQPGVGNTDLVATGVGLGSAQAGVNFMNFGGGSASAGGSLAQNFSTVNGHRYQLTFSARYFGAGETTALQYGVTNTANSAVIIGGTLATGAQLTANGGASATAWNGFAYEFTGTGDTFRVTFADGTTNGSSTDIQLDSVNVVDISAVPGAPTAVSATRGNAQAEVSFTAPSNAGSSAITGYTVTASPGGATASGASSPLTVTGLTNGTSYTFTVTATSVIGTGAASGASSAVTPATVPTVTTPTSASVTATTATLGGNVTADGGSGVTVRGVVVAPTAATSNPQLGLAVVSNVEGAGTTGVFTVAVTGLTAGTAYTFAAYATNNVGTVYSATATFTSTTVPGAPTAVSATRGNTQATVSFTAPVSNGGSAITGFTVTASPGGATASGAGSPLTVTGLTNGTSYTFTVTAANAVGTGPASSASSAVTPATVPGAPTAVSATRGNAQATVGFTAPASTGGSSITGYTVTASPGGATASGAGSPLTVTGLTNGTSYTFTVTATSVIGTGAASSASSAVTPATVPGAPTIGTATGGNAQATVSFTAPVNTGGASLTGYTATASPGGATASGASSPLTVTGLTNGTSYTFTVTATSAAGTGAASSASSAVTPAAPPTVTTPTSASVTATAATLGGNVTAEGGSGVTARGVVVALTATNSNPQLGGTGVTNAAGTGTTGVFTVAVTGLTGGTAYTYAAYATSSAGTTYSSTATFTTSVVAPDAPTAVAAAWGNRQAVVSFTAPASTGGAAITGYTVTATPAGSGPAVTASGSHSPITVTGLTNGTSYTFTVTATNAVGPGPASSASAASTPAPSVTLYAATFEDGTVANWSDNGAAVAVAANPSTGGINPSRYALNPSRGSGVNCYSPAIDLSAYTSGYALTLSFDLLSEATAHSLILGFGSGSTPAGWLVTSTAVDGIWGGPGTFNDDLAATGTWQHFSFNLTPALADWLRTGANAATFRLHLEQWLDAGVGVSYVDNLTLTASPPAVVPDPPTGVSAAAGDTQAAVSFTAPVNPGGALLTGYTATASPGGATASGASSPLTVTGLTNGTSYTFTVTATNSVGIGAASSASSAITPVAVPTISTPPTSSVIVYGQTLAAATLSGGAGGVAGSFAFTTPATAPGAGTAAQGVTFTPTDLVNYTTATTTVNVTVAKATPTLTWSTPSALTYGTTLSGPQLNATASVAGTFVYSPAAGSTPAAGTQTLGVTFTPTDPANYTSATGSVSLVVSQATPTMTTAPTATALTYGQTLADSALSGGAGSVAGRFAFTAPTTAPGAGTAAQSVTFTPTDAANYHSVTTTVNVTVAKATPTITWATPNAITYGTALSGTQLNATASASGNFSYSPASGATLGAGPQSLTASFTPTDSSNYTPATGAVTLAVGQATPTITTAPTASALVYGQTLADSTLSGGAASVAGRFAFTTPTTAPGAGTAAQNVTFTPTDTANYTTATTPVNVTVNRATPTLTWAAPAAILQGTALSGVQLSAMASVAGTFTYSPAAGSTPAAGVQALHATFTPTDTVNYAPATAIVSLAVGKLPTPPVITSVVVGHQQAMVIFNIPADDGGLAITGYTVRATPTGLTPTGGTLRALATRGKGPAAATAGIVVATGTTSPIIVTGLVDGVIYSFSVSAANSLGASVPSAPSDPVMVAAAAPTRLSNMSVRIGAGTGDRTLIVGFVVGGAGTSGAKPLLIRGVGPTLSSYGVAGTLVDPRLALIPQGSSTALAANDNWGGDAQLTAVGNTVGAFPLGSAASKDAALYLTPAKGAYTVQVTGVGGAEGIALAEIYDASGSDCTASTPRLINVSARAQVGTGDGVLIAGFVIEGTASRTVLIRAVGPMLATYGVGGVLADPQLELTQAVNGANVVVASNDNWAGDAQVTSVANTVGAFALSGAASKDAAILVTLPPGIYSAKASGAVGSTGVALIEVYEVP